MNDDLDELSREDTALPAGHLTEAEAAGLFAGLNARIADGRDATAERLHLIRRLKGEGWTQEVIGNAAGISQAAVSKALRTTPGRLALEENGTGPYLIGRMIGLAVHLSGRYGGMRCERQADKLASGGIPPHPAVITQLEESLERDLKRGKGIPDAYRTAFDDIKYRLADLTELPPLPWPVASRSSSVIAQHHQSAWLTDEIARSRKKTAS
jgi:hypothetical protein